MWRSRVLRVAGDGKSRTNPNGVSREGALEVSSERRPSSSVEVALLGSSWRRSSCGVFRVFSRWRRPFGGVRCEVAPLASCSVERTTAASTRRRNAVSDRKSLRHISNSDRKWASLYSRTSNSNPSAFTMTGSVTRGIVGDSVAVGVLAARTPAGVLRKPSLLCLTL